MNDNLGKYLYREESRDDGITPYLSARDFDGLLRERAEFVNSAGLRVVYFFYHTASYRPGKLILFLPGVGPGHKAYLREIASFCAAGYRVLTLDYAGCGESGNEGYRSLYAPAKDTLELLDLLRPAEEITPVGHSLGGFTALTVIRYAKNIRKAVVLAALVSVTKRAKTFDGADGILDYEARTVPELSDAGVSGYLRTTTDRIWFIHSDDDPLFPYRDELAPILEEPKNPNVSLRLVHGRGHNPNYTDGAKRYLTEVCTEYFALVADGTLDTTEKKKEYMKDKSPMEMTHQDPEILSLILSAVEDA